MKKALIIFAWVSILGSIGDGLIALYAGYLVLFDAEVSLSISVDSLIKNHVDFLYWVKTIAYQVMPSKLAGWIFGLPALVYFPVRVVSSILIGWWVLVVAAKMEDKN